MEELFWQRTPLHWQAKEAFEQVQSAKSLELACHETHTACIAAVWLAYSWQ